MQKEGFRLVPSLLVYLMRSIGKTEGNVSLKVIITGKDKYRI